MRPRRATLFTADTPADPPWRTRPCLGMPRGIIEKSPRDCYVNVSPGAGAERRVKRRSISWPIMRRPPRERRRTTLR
jgi:hypothetical protein